MIAIDMEIIKINKQWHILLLLFSLIKYILMAGVGSGFWVQKGLKILYIVLLGRREVGARKGHFRQI